ncbi:hypothetical protein [Legionella jordanis]|nr:hypothetical protein [Legionella jordanis]VEH12952.1 Uncharacterised protein [Legionella jordanis]
MRFAIEENVDFIYETLSEDLREQGVLHRFKYSKPDFKQAFLAKGLLLFF